jgi:hypothetical protein
MIPMSSRRRAVVKFPMEYALFVNKKAHMSMTGINQYYIKSAYTIMDTRRQASNGCIRLSIIFYDPIVAQLCVSLLSKFLMTGFLGNILDYYCKNNA